MKKIKIKIIPISLILLSIIFIAYAATYYQVASGTTEFVYEYGVCKKVTNNNGLAIFVPTNSEAEWTAFRDNAQNVVLVECLCPDGSGTDDSSCGTIDCDGLDNYYISGTQGATSTSYCKFNNYVDLTSNRCEGVEDCKDANTADCGSPTLSTTVTAGTCDYVSGCSGSTSGTLSFYSSGTDTGLCRECDGSGAEQVSADDSDCGTIDCDGMNYYYLSASNSAYNTNYCYYRDYADLTSNRCEGLSDCKDANTADCTSYSNIKKNTAGTCQYIDGCSGSTSGTVETYPYGTQCGSSGYECHGTSCEWGGSTPYLFSGVDNDYYIENDVLSTYFNQYYENAKKWYEEDSGDKQVYTLTDYYEMKLNPTVEAEGVKLLLKEIEPEESHIDEVRLLRTIYDNNANLIIDHEENSIKVVEEKLINNNIISCNFKGENCIKNIEKTDNKFISAVGGEKIRIKFNISGLRNKEVYLIVNSWNHIPMKNQLAPLEGYSAESIKTTFNLGNGKSKVVRDIHPREIESNHYLYIGDIIDEVEGDILGVNELFTQEHNLDSIQMMIVEEKPYQQEELSLIGAEHDKDGNVLFELSNIDHMYAHTVRGDEIEMLFSKPQLELKEGEKETYVFVSSGFYHGLRTYLYPNVNPKSDYLPEIEKYVKKLK